jgi:hypothetical protein
VAKIAMGHRGYGLPNSEVISEGNVELMQAVKRFEPDRGFCLAAYAVWWITTSDAGALLLGATDRAMGMMARFASCLCDTRRQPLVFARAQLDPLRQTGLCVPKT